MSHGQVFLFDSAPGPGLGFDTGLSSRAFAQAKFAQVITEPGFRVRGDCVDLWKALGVIEYPHENRSPTMLVWGPPFKGERLDLLLNEGEKDASLAAISRWIQAVLAAEKAGAAVPLWPCAAIMGENEVFFAPPSLARRCVVTFRDEGFVHPDAGTDAGAGATGAAFTAAAMLYRVFAGAPPFPATDEFVLHQDMRDGNFLPVRFAVPGLDARLAALIQNALSPGGAAPLDEILAALRKDNQTAASFVQPLSQPETLALEKEKNQFLKVHTASVKTRRFVMRNMAALIASFAGLIVAAILVSNVISVHANLPTTAGMEPVEVIASYYNAFGDLDHQMMEACVTRGAGRNDISGVMNFFVINKVRQAYEYSPMPIVIPAREWQEKGGGPLDMPVFGVTDLRVEQIAESGETPSAAALHYRVDYILWVPAEVYDDEISGAQASGDPGPGDERLPRSVRRCDFLTLIQKKGNWRIAELQRQ